MSDPGVGIDQEPLNAEGVTATSTLGPKHH